MFNPWSKLTQWQRDTAERVAATFVQAALASLAVTGVGTSLPDVKVAAVSAVTAGVAAAVSVVKAIVARKVGDANSASLSAKVTNPPKRSHHKKPVAP